MSCIYLLVASFLKPPMTCENRKYESSNAVYMSIYKRFGSISKSGNVYWAIYWSFVTVTIGAVIISLLPGVKISRQIDKYSMNQRYSNLKDLFANNLNTSDFMSDFI